VVLAESDGTDADVDHWPSLREETLMLIAAILWVGCAVAIVTAAVRSRHDVGALRFGRRSVAVLYLGAGAAVNAFFLLRGDDYAKFADGAYVRFVRDTWRDVVVPHHHLWIALLIAFELAVGALALLGGRRTQLGYVAAVAFHVALVSFGWGFYLWSVPMVWALSVLLRGELRAADTKPSSAFDQVTDHVVAA
jgi:hypothetical protein